MMSLKNSYSPSIFLPRYAASAACGLMLFFSAAFCPSVDAQGSNHPLYAGGDVFEMNIDTGGSSAPEKRFQLKFTPNGNTNNNFEFFTLELKEFNSNGMSFVLFATEVYQVASEKYTASRTPPRKNFSYIGDGQRTLAVGGDPTDVSINGRLERKLGGNGMAFKRFDLTSTDQGEPDCYEYEDVSVNTVTDPDGPVGEDQIGDQAKDDKTKDDKTKDDKTKGGTEGEGEGKSDAEKSDETKN